MTSHSLKPLAKCLIFKNSTTGWWSQDVLPLFSPVMSHHQSLHCHKYLVWNLLTLKHKAKVLRLLIFQATNWYTVISIQLYPLSRSTPKLRHCAIIWQICRPWWTFCRRERLNLVCIPLLLQLQPPVCHWYRYCHYWCPCQVTGWARWILLQRPQYFFRPVWVADQWSQETLSCCAIVGVEIECWGSTQSRWETIAAKNKILGKYPTMDGENSFPKRTLHLDCSKEWHIWRRPHEWRRH